ncbi:Speckle-type POZ protein [Araneus ventricosus]|uniref:Speckle-type POZ protein n=1 Tax=Araneus ventricosus TaxID=182803 RepID=A0A4Y2TUJ1_ARAVE|nr:Speckle-type POZ protein [Araneus ventricosus]
MTKFTFQWWIENYRYCFHDNGEKLASPMFTAEGLEGTIWTVDLYPRGRHDDDKGHISLFLSRSREDGGPERFPLEFELSILGLGVADVYSEDMSMYFEKGQTHGCPRLMKRDKVISSPDGDDGYIPLGTLTVHCKIWKGQGHIHKVAPVCARTRIGVEDICFQHVVENFCSLKPNQKNSIHFLSHSKIGCVVCNHYFTEDGEMVVEIMPSNSNHILCACVVSLLSASGKVLESVGFENVSDALRQDIRKRPLRRALTRQSILDTQVSLLDDTLRLLYKCYFSTGVDFEEITETQHGMSVATLNQISSNIRKKRCEPYAERLCVSEGMKSFCSNQCPTDVELEAKTKSFSAHTAVLCAKSPVFKAMMISDMAGKSKKCIKLDGLEDDTVQQLLLFLYSDCLENLGWDDMTKLYYAAYKYEIEKLKVLCTSFLAEKLSTSNAGELLLLADTHNDADLKKFVEDFILENEELVFGSDEWKKVMATNPQLGMKTMLLKYKRM